MFTLSNIGIHLKLFLLVLRSELVWVPSASPEIEHATVPLLQTITQSVSPHIRIGLGALCVT